MKVQCTTCIQLVTGCTLTLKRELMFPMKHLPAASNYPVSYLSPGSQVTRRMQLRQKNKLLTQKLVRLQEELAICLREDQSQELTEIVAEIQGKHIDEINEVLTEADEKGKGDIMRALWEQDVQEHREFQKDQRKNSKYTCIYTYMHVHVHI